MICVHLSPFLYITLSLPLLKVCVYPSYLQLFSRIHYYLSVCISLLITISTHHVLKISVTFTYKSIENASNTNFSPLEQLSGTSSNLSSYQGRVCLAWQL